MTLDDFPTAWRGPVGRFLGYYRSFFALNRTRYVRGRECNPHFRGLQVSESLAEGGNRFSASDRPREALGRAR
jgi:hypothetical protein